MASTPENAKNTESLIRQLEESVRADEREKATLNANLATLKTLVSGQSDILELVRAIEKRMIFLERCAERNYYMLTTLTQGTKARDIVKEDIEKRRTKIDGEKLKVSVHADRDARVSVGREVAEDGEEETNEG